MKKKKRKNRKKRLTEADMSEKQKKNGAPDPMPMPELNRDRLNMAGRPFTKYRGIELVLCAAAVVLGLLYLNTDLVTLAFLLPFYCVCFLAIPVLRYLEGRALGIKGAIHWITLACWGVLAAAMLAVTAGYFMG